MSICCRPATRRARLARTSKRGSAFAQAGRFREAWEALIRDNPMPAVHGRVCYHPCETSCNRKELDSPVAIHAVERFLGDLAASEAWPMPAGAAPTGKRVLIVGAGPSGLSAAYHLTRLGHQVEIHDAGPLPGGMLHFGIPAYRLPRADLMKEIRRIEEMGVTIVLDHKVDDVLAEQEDGRLRRRLHRHRRPSLQTRGHPGARRGQGARRGVDVARRRDRASAPLLGRRVVVYGGGNTAMDAARTRAPARRRRRDDRLSPRPGAHARP